MRTFVRILSLCLACFAAHANPVRLADIAPTAFGQGSSPGNLVSIGSILYFSASSPAGGSELWRSDGTTPGTFMVKDICPGACSSSPGELIVLGTSVYFFADDGVSGLELWKSDGTAAGTVLVKDIYPGPQHSNPKELVRAPGVLYFSANDGVNGQELWKSDGTAAGTVLVRDIRSGATGSDPSSLAVIGSTVYFAADNGSSGVELWKSNGVASGTVLVADIMPGSVGSIPSCLVNFGGTLLFTATDSGGGREVWRSDGTAVGTDAVSSIDAGGNTGPTACPVVAGSLAYFPARTAVSGEELWRTDGTPAGTAMVKNIASGSTGSVPSLFLRALSADDLWFSADDGINGRELWKTDGAGVGTAMFDDLRPGSLGSFPRPLAILGGELLFSADNGASGMELWITDGTVARLVRDINAGSGGSSAQVAHVVGSRAFFTAYTDDQGYELWVTDGTPAGTRAVADIAAGPQPSSFGRRSEWTGRELYFQGGRFSGTAELWRSDGTSAGTRLVKSIPPPASDASAIMKLKDFAPIGGVTLFTVTDAAVVGPTALWRTDGTSAGTRVVTGFDGDTASVGTVIPANGFAYFSGTDRFGISSLWRTDGDDFNTYALCGCTPRMDLAAMLGNVLYFPAFTSASGTELWRSDGTAAGTFVVKEITPGAASTTFTSSAATVNKTLFFALRNAALEHELWKSNGTAAGTVLVKVVAPAGAGSGPQDLTASGNLVFFRNDDGVSGRELWRSDGTAAGTFLVKDLTPGPDPTEIFPMVDVAGTLFFTANTPGTGRELWKSDGTAAGTVLVKDIAPGVEDAAPDSLVVAGNRLYFRARTVAEGTELWTSDGTAAGTFLLKDLNPGPASSSIFALAAAGDRLFFTGLDGGPGEALWIYLLEPPASGLTLEPAALAFANQALQTTSASQVLTLTNHSTPAANLGVVGAVGDFLVTTTTCGAQLAPGASCTISVAFRPTAAGPRGGNASIVVGSAAPVTIAASLSGTGVAGAPLVPTVSGGGSSSYGAPVTFAASVAVATAGTVFFLDGGNFIGAASFNCAALPCTAAFTTRSLGAGNHAIAAQFLGNGTYPGATSGTIGHAVNPAASAIVVASSAPTAAPSTPITFTAVVASAGEQVTGAVAFLDGGVPMPGCGASAVQPDGTARCTISTLAAGVHAISSQYSGDGNNQPSASNPITQKVSVFTDTITPGEASLDFGGQSLHTSAPSRAVAIANTSGAPLAITTITASANFAVTHDCASLAPSATCTATVTFTPTLEGPIGGSLTITASTGLQAVALAGVGEKSLVTHYYRSILRRAPDAPGKAFWSGEAARLQSAGANVNEAWFAMAQSFYASAEYAAFGRDDAGFVSDLYNTFFNRAADGPGLAFWTGQVAQGMPREVVLAGFLFSTEFTTFTQGIFGNTQARKEIDTVMDFYRGLLGRTPDAGGLTFWIQQFRAAQCQGAAAVTAQAEGISSAFATGGEYAARNRSNAQYVGDLYNAFLRRGGDLAGVQFWINAIASNALTREQVRQQFVASGEFQARVQAVIAQGCLP